MCFGRIPLKRKVGWVKRGDELAFGHLGARTQIKLRELTAHFEGQVDPLCGIHFSDEGVTFGGAAFCHSGHIGGPNGLGRIEGVRR